MVEFGSHPGRATLTGLAGWAAAGTGSLLRHKNCTYTLGAVAAVFRGGETTGPFGGRAAWLPVWRVHVAFPYARGLP